MPTDFISKPPYSVVQPGAYSAVDASLLGSPSFQTGRPIPMILGTALGGKPNTPLYFRSPGQLRAVLRGGIGYDVARFTFDGGAPQVGFVRVGNSITPGTLALAGTTGTIVTLTSQDYGSWVNSIKITVATGNVITLSYTDALGNTFTEKWDLSTVTGLTDQNVADAINGKLPGYSGSNFVTATVGTGTLPLTVISNVPLAGGTDGLTPAAGDWTTGLSAIETEIIDFVLVATGDATIHAQVQTHIQNMSAPGARRERTTVLGGVAGETAAQAITRIKALPSGRVELVYPGMYDFDASGNQVLYDPFYHAGKIAGMHCAQPDVATSILHQHVPIIKAEVDLSTIQGGAIDQLLQAGVTPIAPAPAGGYWVVDALTGYTGSDQTFRDLTKTRSADFAAQYARQVLESAFVGSKSLAGSQASIAVEANSVMDQLVGMQIIQAHQASVVAAGPTTGSWLVSLPVMLIDTNKFIFITVQLQPSSTVASSTTVQDLT